MPRSSSKSSPQATHSPMLHLAVSQPATTVECMIATSFALRRIAVFVAIAIATSAAPLALRPASAQTVTPTAAVTTARQLLALVPTAAEQSSSTYSRAAFRHWVDADRDCQDARAEVLIRKSRTPVTFTTLKRCTVVAGSWFSWYDGATLSAASSVDVDHVVALKEAWESGAHAWSPTDRERYANDLGFAGSLQAIRDSVNQSKSDRDPAQWMPPRAAARCEYAATWVQVKFRWRLAVDTAERSALNRTLASCPGTSIVSPPRAR